MRWDNRACRIWCMFISGMRTVVPWSDSECSSTRWRWSVSFLMERECRQRINGFEFEPNSLWWSTWYNSCCRLTFWSLSVARLCFDGEKPVDIKRSDTIWSVPAPITWWRPVFVEVVMIGVLVDWECGCGAVLCPFGMCSGCGHDSLCRCWLVSVYSWITMLSASTPWSSSTNLSKSNEWMTIEIRFYVERFGVKSKIPILFLLLWTYTFTNTLYHRINR